METGAGEALQMFVIPADFRTCGIQGLRERRGKATEALNGRGLGGSRLDRSKYSITFSTFQVLGLQSVRFYKAIPSAVFGHWAAGGPAG